MTSFPGDHLPFAAEARRVLGDELYRYLVGAPADRPAEAGDGNEAAMQGYRLVPRVMRGILDCDMGTMFGGRRAAGPLAVGAFAGDRVFASDGLLPIVRACHQVGLPIIVSEETVTPFADIAALHDMCWLQLRAAGPLERVLGLIDMAADVGAAGCVLTVLASVHPRAGLQPGDFSIADEIARRGWPTIGAPEGGVAPLTGHPAWRWSDIAAVAAHLKDKGLSLFVKGVLHADDARQAEAAGAAGIIASNIGLRQSGRWVAPVECLPALGAAATVPVLLDGGLRHGADLVVAVCLGASLGIVTRPVITALVGAGESAVERLLRRLLDEAAAIASWCGAGTLAELSPDMIRTSSQGGGAGR